AAAAPAPPLIIIDGPNVAMRAGGTLSFVSGGIAAAAKFFQDRGHRVVALLPEATASPDAVAAQRRAAAAGFAVSPARLPDDLALLTALTAAGVLLPVAGRDSDGAVALRHALKHPGACILSNDRYRDWLAG